MFQNSPPPWLPIRWISSLCILVLFLFGGLVIVAAQDQAGEPDVEVELEQALKEAQDELNKALEQFGLGFDEAARAFTEALKNIDFERTLETAMRAAEQAMKLADVEFSRMMEEMERSMASFREGRGAPSTAPPLVPHAPHAPHAPSTGFSPFAPKIDSLLGQYQGEIHSAVHEERVVIQAGAPVYVESTFTDVTVLPSGDASVLLVKAEITGGGPSEEEARRMAETLTLEIIETPERVQVFIRQLEPTDQNMSRDRRGRFQSAKLHILAPNSSPLQVNNSFGAVHIAERRGGTISKNEFGPMLITDLEGDLSAHNEYGPLNIQGHRGAASIVCKFGALHLERIDGAYSVRTEYGNANIKGISSNATLTGSFQFGDAHVQLPRDYAGRIGAEASMGSIQAPSELTVKEEGMFNKSLQGLLNDGDGRIQLSSSFGGIHMYIEG